MAQHIRRVIDGSDNPSNYRLLKEPVKLQVKVAIQWTVPDGDGWEPVGVSSHFNGVETDHFYKKKMQLRGSRKQRAARAVSPRESIKVIDTTMPVSKPVTMAILEGKTDKEVKVVSLQTEIQRLWGIVNAPAVAARTKQEAISELERMFNSRRI